MKCHYCDFYSLAAHRTTAEQKDRFRQALRREVELRRPQTELKTLFFGGGTPSMTPPEVMAEVLEPLGPVAPTAEWTMEANPSSLNPDNLAGYRRLGVNRLSMGVQALNDDLLKLLGRVHSGRQALLALEQVFAAGFDNVSVDLICGVPGQTAVQLRAAIAALTAFPITHLSCYLLTLPKHHALYRQLPDEDAQLEQLLLIDREMSEQGFEHYEISNFARPGRRAQHNLAYWKGEFYRGLGPSAHSFQGGVRSKNVSSLARYCERLEGGAVPVDWRETLTPDQKHLEKWMLALRLREGFPRDWLESTGQRAAAQRFVDTGLLASNQDRFWATPRGFALSDSLISALAT